MIDPAEWLEQAQKLPLGGRSAIKHSCGDGKKLVIDHKEHGWSCYCYRGCGTGFVPKPKPSLAERIAALSAKTREDKSAAASIKPPMPSVPAVDDWPDAAKVWLYKSGFDKDWIEGIGFYWCPRLERVVMPVLDDDGRLCFWQARSFDPTRPKYLSPGLEPGQAKPIYKAHPFRPDPDRNENILCLTEDILSANKVGQCVTGWSILGTSLTPSAEAEIVKFGASRVWVWLDPDQAGINGRRKIVPQLRALGIDAKAVRADLDPKCYPLEQIRAKLV